MRATRGHGVAIIDARIIAATLLVSLFVLFIFPAAAHAQAVPPTDTTNDVPADETTEPGDIETPPAEPTVQAPGTPVATSPNTDPDIVWEWVPPQGGTTPDAPVVEPVEPTEPTEPTEQPAETVEPPVVEYPTDIIKYGYELTDQGVVITSGEVESTIYTLTTKVSGNGNYVFKVWSITREAKTSDFAYGYMTIVSPVPVIPDYPPLVVPAPIGAIPTTDTPTIQQVASTAPTYYASTLPQSTSPVDPGSTAGVLSGSDTVKSDTPEEELATVVVPSNQGWIIFGLPWYLWLLIVAVIFSAWRWAAMVAANRQ